MCVCEVRYSLEFISLLPRQSACVGGGGVLSNSCGIYENADSTVSSRRRGRTQHWETCTSRGLAALKHLRGWWPRPPCAQTASLTARFRQARGSIGGGVRDEDPRSPGVSGRGGRRETSTRVVAWGEVGAALMCGTALRFALHLRGARRRGWNFETHESAGTFFFILHACNLSLVLSSPTLHSRPRARRPPPPPAGARSPG